MRRGWGVDVQCRGWVEESDEACRECESLPANACLQRREWCGLVPPPLETSACLRGK